MKTEILPNGNLRFTVTEQERKLLAELAEEMGDEFDQDVTMYDWFETTIGREGLEWLWPEDIGALTSAPILGRDDDAWGFMDYQVISAQRRLLDQGYADWQKG